MSLQKRNVVTPKNKVKKNDSNGTNNYFRESLKIINSDKIMVSATQHVDYLHNRWSETRRKKRQRRQWKSSRNTTGGGVVPLWKNTIVIQLLLSLTLTFLSLSWYPENFRAFAMEMTQYTETISVVLVPSSQTMRYSEIVVEEGVTVELLNIKVATVGFESSHEARLDLVLFRIDHDDEPQNAQKWGNVPLACQMAEDGVGGITSDGEARFCCTDIAFDYAVCKSSHYGRLIVNSELFRGFHRSFNMPNDPNHIKMIPNGDILLTEPGRYVFMFTSCDEGGQSVHLSGTIVYDKSNSNNNNDDTIAADSIMRDMDQQQQEDTIAAGSTTIDMDQQQQEDTIAAGSTTIDMDQQQQEDIIAAESTKIDMDQQQQEEGTDRKMLENAADMNTITAVTTTATTTKTTAPSDTTDMTMHTKISKHRKGLSLFSQGSLRSQISSGQVCHDTDIPLSTYNEVYLEPNSTVVNHWELYKEHGKSIDLSCHSIKFTAEEDDDTKEFEYMDQLPPNTRSGPPPNTRSGPPPNTRSGPPPNTRSGPSDKNRDPIIENEIPPQVLTKTQIDVAIFQLPTEMDEIETEKMLITKPCDWYDQGIGVIDDNGQTQWCCNTEAIANQLCDERLYGRLIYNYTKFHGERRVIDFPEKGHFSAGIRKGTFESLDNGVYVFVFANCNDYGRRIKLSGENVPIETTGTNGEDTKDCDIDTVHYEIAGEIMVIFPILACMFVRLTMFVKKVVKDAKQSSTILLL